VEFKIMTRKNHVQPTEREESGLIENVLPFASRVEHCRRKAGPSLAGPEAGDAYVPIDDDDPGPTAA
jgi:hypothetical protein